MGGRGDEGNSAYGLHHTTDESPCIIREELSWNMKHELVIGGKTRLVLCDTTEEYACYRMQLA